MTGRRGKVPGPVEVPGSGGLVLDLFGQGAKARDERAARAGRVEEGAEAPSRATLPAASASELFALKSALVAVGIFAAVAALVEVAGGPTGMLGRAMQALGLQLAALGAGNWG